MQQYFAEHILPRRVRDFNAEVNYEKSHGEKKIIFRRVLPNEVGVGEPFPVWTAGIDTFATFGKGIGIYFMQLLILSLVALVGGMIMMIASNEYKKSNYGINEQDTDDQFLLISAACKPFTYINVTEGCGTGVVQCTISLRNDCGLPTYAVYADLVMSLLFAVVVFISRYLEKRIETNLDEAIQTVQDYSVVVQDPTPDADDPDEWYEFFSRFGKVRYVTVVRDNENLVGLVVQKHQLEIKSKTFLKHYREHRRSQDRSSVNEKVLVADGGDLFADVSGESKNPQNFKNIHDNVNPSSHHDHHNQLMQRSSRYHILTKKLSKLDKQIQVALRNKYPVTKVFITFEFEEHQRLCLQSLEVPDINAYFDCLDKSQGRKLFRGVNVLNVQEPPEADNIRWENLSYSITSRFFRQFISWVLTMAILAASWYLIKITNKVSSTFLATVIGVVDAMLPNIFQALTKYTKPQSQSHFENSLQMKLFAARLMLSTILPYVQTSWNQVLDIDFIRQISVVQVATCFTAPIIAFMDPSGYIKRFWLGPWLSDTQEELNGKWSGTDWSLAERYTGIAKILFVSIYYALITPYSILLCFIAFVLSFLIDRYLLLRQWKRACMLDADVAIRLRQQALLAIATHMYITMRFIYSWPMDEAYWNPNLQQYQKVDKYPSISAMLSFSRGSNTDNNDDTTSVSSLDWQTAEQQHVFLIYKITFYFIAAIVVVSWLLIPLYHYLHRTFFYTLELVGNSQQIPFSDIAQITVYEPLITTTFHGESKVYLCSYTKEMLQQHRPPLLHLNSTFKRVNSRRRFGKEEEDDDNVDLSDYVMEEKQKHVLSVVKFYGDEMAELGLNEQGQPQDRDDDSIVDSRIISISEAKPGRGLAERGYEIKTTHDGILTRVPEMTNPSLHPDLFMKIAPRVIDLGGGEVSPSKIISSGNKAQHKSTHDHEDSKSIGFAPKKASFTKAKRAERRDEKEKKERLREEKYNISSDPKRQFSAKPLYQHLYGVSSSSGSNSDSDDYFVRISKDHSRMGQSKEFNKVTFAKQDSAGNNISAKAPLPSNDQTVPALKRSDSPPRGNFRHKKF